MFGLNCTFLILYKIFMIEIVEILKYILPAGVVFATAYFLINRLLENDYKVKLLELKKSNRKDVLPIKLQAFERMVLYLERIAPNNLLMRIQHTSLTVRQLQSALHKTIRTEFEHNLSQQIYMNTTTWEAVKKAKEEVIQLINVSAEGLNEDAPAVELSQAIIIVFGKQEKSPIQKAIELLKKEINEIL